MLPTSSVQREERYGGNVAISTNDAVRPTAVTISIVKQKQRLQLCFSCPKDETVKGGSRISNSRSRSCVCAIYLIITSFCYVWLDIVTGW